MKNRTFCGEKFTPIIDGYICHISKHRYIIITKNLYKGWTGKYRRLTGEGKYMTGGKYWETVSEISDKTLQVTAKRIIEMVLLNE